MLNALAGILLIVGALAMNMVFGPMAALPMLGLAFCFFVLAERS